MCAVNSTKCIRYEYLCHGSQFLSEISAVLFLADIVSQILKEQKLARLQSSGLCLSILTDDIFCEDDILAEKLTEAFCNRSQAEFRFPLTLGFAKVGTCNDCRSVFQQILDGGQSSNNTFIAGNLSSLFVQRNIEITSQKNFFTLYLCVFYAFFVVVHSRASINN